MFDARLTPVVASITALAQSPSVAFTLGSETGKSSCRFEANLIVVDQLFSPRQLRGTAAAVGLEYVSHCYPFFHNMVMVFRRA